MSQPRSQLPIPLEMAVSASSNSFTGIDSSGAAADAGCREMKINFRGGEGMVIVRSDRIDSIMQLLGEVTNSWLQPGKRGISNCGNRCQRIYQQHSQHTTRAKCHRSKSAAANGARATSSPNRSHSYDVAASFIGPIGRGVEYQHRRVFFATDEV